MHSLVVLFITRRMLSSRLRVLVKMMDSTNGIAGHEGAGIVAAVHPDVADIWKVGDRAGVKWVVSVCRNCEFCTNGTDELHCPKQLNSGFSAPGTFQEYCVTDGRYATRYEYFNCMKRQCSIADIRKNS